MKSVSVDAAGLSYEYENPKFTMLIDLCRRLQASAGSEPFPLSCRAAGEAIGVSTKDASVYLSVLYFDGVITKVSQGTGESGPSRYRYLGA